MKSKKRLFISTLSLILLLSMVFGLTASAFSLFGDSSSPVPTETAQGAPIAMDISLKTYRNIDVSGLLQGLDPEGDAITFAIESEPKRGSLIYDEDNAKFVYMPKKNKSGTEEFTYVAVDANGNTSAPATVTITIEKQSGDVAYADMVGNSAYYAALRLTEEGIFTGCQIGNKYCFMPEKSVTRGEFIAMTMTLVGATAENGTSITGFADDEVIGDWLRPYVNAALQAGIIRGVGSDGGALYLEPDREISRGEAAVVLSSALSISDMLDSSAFTEDVPSWARQAAANVSSCGIMSADQLHSGGYSQSVSRAEAAEMLLAALELMESRTASGGLFSWAQ